MEGSWWRTFYALAHPLGGFIVRLLRRVGLQIDFRKMQLLLYRSGLGGKVDPQSWLGLKATFSLLVALVSAFLFLILSGSLAFKTVFFLCVLFLGFRLPDWRLESRGRERRKAIDSQLPYAVDLLATCCLAGLNIHQAMTTVLAEIGGVLGEEITVSLGQLELGMGKDEVLKEMRERTASHSLVDFFSFLFRAEKLGTPLEDVLASKSRDVRDLQRSSVEKKARQAPVLLLFPLVFLILPSFILLTVGIFVLPILKM